MIAAVGAALAAVLGFATFGGTALTALAVGLVQAALVVGWLRAVAVPEPVLGVLLAAVVAALSDALVVGHGGSHPMEAVALVLGPAVVLGFLVQLVRRAPRAGLTPALTASALLTSVAVLASFYVAARGTRGGAPLVAATAAGAFVAAVLALVPAPGSLHRRFSAPGAGRAHLPGQGTPARTSLEPLVRAVAAGVVGAGAGAVVGATTDLGASAGAWLGAVAGLVAGVGRVLAHDAISAAGPVVTGDVLPTDLPVPGPGSAPSTAPGSAPSTATAGGSAPATGSTPADVLPAAVRGQAVDPGFAVLVAAALPIALAGPVSYVLGRILVG